MFTRLYGAGDHLAAFLNKTHEPTVIETIRRVQRMKPSSRAESRIRDAMAGRDWSPAQRALLLVFTIYQAGLLAWVRQCKRQACAKWFMASREKQAFCSSDCQEDYWSEYRKTPAGLKKQARWMAKWRAKTKAKGRKQR